MRVTWNARCRWGIAIGGLLLTFACAPASLVDVQPPSGVVDPGVVKTAAGAAQLYNQTLNRFSQVYGGATGSIYPTFILGSAIFTDELEDIGNGNFSRPGWDARRLSVGNAWVANYSEGEAQALHQPRVEARQAREALMLYAPTTPKALQGHLYAIEAYTLLWFAEAYCSGIALSTVSLVGSAVPTAGFTTQDLFERAAAMFDSAMTLGADSARFVNLAKIGKGRALLGLGRFADAAAAVQGVPTDFVYGTEHGTTAGVNFIGRRPQDVQVADGEGGNGLIWSTDLRTATTTVPALAGAMKITAKYSHTSVGTLDPTQSIVDNPTRLADGLEARLIEAEADLAANGTNWLALLNTLRSTCLGAAPCAPVPGLTAVALPPLADPGTANGRLSLVMAERAMWLYLTGHRQGDLRRLAHVYHRDPTTLWPMGIYTNPGFPPLVSAPSDNGVSYGSDVVWKPYGNSAGETFTNLLYTGCFNVDP